MDHTITELRLPRTCTAHRTVEGQCHEHDTPSALVDGRVSQAEEYLKGSSVLTIQRREMYQGLSFPDAETGVRMFWHLPKNDVMYIERGNGKGLNTTTTPSL